MCIFTGICCVLSAGIACELHRRNEITSAEVKREFLSLKLHMLASESSGFWSCYDISLVCDDQQRRSLKNISHQYTSNKKRPWTRAEDTTDIIENETTKKSHWHCSKLILHKKFCNNGMISGVVFISAWRFEKHELAWGSS